MDSLTKLFAPILAFTCDEIWLAMPHRNEDDGRNVLFNEMNQPFTAYALDDAAMGRWAEVIRVRDTVNGVLETARKEKKLGKSLEAKVTLTVADPDSFLLPEMDEDALADILIVSQVALAKGQGELEVQVENAQGEKCQRCWKVLPSVSGDLCPRCARVIGRG